LESGLRLFPRILLQSAALPYPPSA